MIVGTASEWRTPEVVALVETMVESRDFTDMPRLAHCLRRAGCTSREVLDHCRDVAAFHVHGCWVIDAILAGSGATKAKATKTAKPKKPTESPLLAVMKPTERRLFKGLIDDPSRLFKEDWHQRFALVGNTADWLRSLGKAEELIRIDQDQILRLYPDLSPDRLSFLWPLLAIPLGNGLERRIWFDDPTELIRGLSYHVRQMCLTSFVYGNADDAPQLLLEAMAIRDSLAIAKLQSFMVDRPAMRWDDSFLLRNALVAIARKDIAGIQIAAERISLRGATTWNQNVDTVIRGIATSDPALIATAIQQSLETDRAARERLSWGITCLESHQLYRMAEWISPELVVGIDTHQAWPWDAPFFDAVSASTNPMSGVDLNFVSPLLHQAVVELRFPDWLVPSEVQLAERRRNRDVVLVDAGRRTADVANYLRNWMEVKTPEIKRRIGSLPMTIKSLLPLDAVERIQTELAELGARVELLPVVATEQTL